MGNIKETFFISHGSPLLSTDESLEAWHFFKSWRDTVYPHTPNSILVISAHWETHVPTVNTVNGRNDTVLELRGFPKHVYSLKYPAPGAPHLANRVKELLLASGHKRVDEDKKRGLDNGAWVPLMLMYPEAQIPVCQLSVQTERDGNYHYNLGKALSPLKEEGVLIIGSGSTTHNIGALSLTDDPPAPWAVAFDTWLQETLLQGRYEDINKYEEKAPHAKTAHPRPEHFYPLHVAIGAAGEQPKAELIHHSWSNGSLSYASYKFTSTTASQN